MTVISQFEIFLDILVRSEKNFIRKLGKFNTSSHITEKYLHFYTSIVVTSNSERYDIMKYLQNILWVNIANDSIYKR